MPDIPVGSGSTKTIINEEDAEEILDEEGRYQRVILDINTNPIRVVSKRDEDQAREGFPFPAGSTVVGFRPQGNEILAYGDGSGSSTVHIHLVSDGTFDIDGGEVDL